MDDQPPMPLASHSRHRRKITIGLTAVALLAGGGVAIAAGQPDTPGDTTASPTAGTTAAKPAPGKGVRGLAGGVLHGEYVVPDGSGGYRTQVVQMGEIESVDDSSLTVASEDGYKRSYARTADTVVGGANWAVTKNDDGSFTVRKGDGALAAGQQVFVTGTLDGEKATATRIAARPDGDLPAGIMKRFGGDLGGLGGPMDKLKEGLVQKFKQRMDEGTMPGRPGQEFTMPAPDERGGTVRRFEFNAPDGGRGELRVVPERGAAEAEPGPQSAPARPVPPPAPAEPSSATSSGSVAPA